ncbi:MAG: carboxymuconolactone decarboxylase family protein [Nevskia sp.]|nr:carboxymuconolactone decarboxylase family protein [Nevskia sp.]
MPPRIAPVDPPYSAGLQQDFDRVMRGLPPLNIFRTVARNPRVLSRMIAGGLLDRGSISLRERELVILRTCALCGAEYEWGVHVAAYGAKAQFTPQQVAATVHRDDAAWGANELLLLRLCEELQRQQDVGDALWARLREAYDEAQLIELLMLAGFYRMVSYVVNATRMDLQPGAPRFPAQPKN